MAYRSAAAMRLAVLLSGMLPVAALAPAPRASAQTEENAVDAAEGSGTETADLSGTAPARKRPQSALYRSVVNPLRASPSFPAVHFAESAGEEASTGAAALGAAALRTSGKSVLAPPGGEWLKQRPKPSDLPRSPLSTSPRKALSTAPSDPLADVPDSLGGGVDPLGDDLPPSAAPVLGGPLSIAPPEPLSIDGQVPGVVGPALASPLGPGDVPLGVPQLGADTTIADSTILDASDIGSLPSMRRPMMRESWLYRPFNVSLFEGALFAAPPITPQFNTTVSYFTGLRIGWDFSKYFGGEERFGFSKVFLLDGATHSIQVGYQRLFYFDANLLIYPWGDTKVRPYLSLGSGYADVFIVSNTGLRLHPGAFNMPMGVGVKYRHSSRIAFRADFRDNLTFSGGGGMRTLNNIEFVGGVEFHFGGGNRKTYWPWNPSHHWW